MSVSVIIRTKDRPELLSKAISSVQAGTYSETEIVVVNDGGTPPLEGDVIINNPVSKGRSTAANQGLKAASGRYICFLDDDDEFYPEHLTTLVKEISNSDASVVYSDALQATVQNSEPVSFDLKYSIDYSPEKLHKANLFPIQCVLFDKELEGEFDPILERLEDWDFWLQLSKQTPFRHVKKITSEYRHEAGKVFGDEKWSWAERYVRNKHGLKPDNFLSEGFLFQ